jgi:hypothetical protein
LTEVLPTPADTDLECHISSQLDRAAAYQFRPGHLVCPGPREPAPGLSAGMPGLAGPADCVAAAPAAVRTGSGALAACGTAPGSLACQCCRPWQPGMTRTTMAMTTDHDSESVIMMTNSGLTRPGPGISVPGWHDPLLGPRPWARPAAAAGVAQSAAAAAARDSDSDSDHRDRHGASDSIRRLVTEYSH